MAHFQQYDAIVIGSGIGGLTVAAILSKFNHKKVLVLEQHFTVGGFIQEFSHQGFRWDIGVQALGDMAKGDTGRTVFDYITEGQLQWQKLPDPNTKIVYPDFTFEIYSDPKRYRSDLIKLFPAEKVSIQRYFFDIQKATFWYGVYLIADQLPRWLQAMIKRLIHRFGRIVRLTTQDYLDRHFQNPQLKALLTSQWIGYGLPPSQSAFGIHAIVTSNFSKGCWYPVGGSKAITDRILPTIESTGGTVLTQRHVTEIIVKNGVAMGVKAQKTHTSAAELETYYAPVIISNAGAFNTYTKLLPEGWATVYRNQIKAFPKGYSMLLLFLGLKQSPETMGFSATDHWIYTAYDHDKMLQEQQAAPETVLNCLLSFPSLKNSKDDRHTAEIAVFTDYDYFAKWQGQLWKKRDREYYELKERIAQQMIDFVERRYPGFKTLIACYELATPLTMEYFDVSDKGAVYGIPWVPERFDQPWASAKTPIKNLYLTGADALVHGVEGAMIGGVMTAGFLNGWFGFFKIMFAMRQATFVTSVR